MKDKRPCTLISARALDKNIRCSRRFDRNCRRASGHGRLARADDSNFNPICDQYTSSPLPMALRDRPPYAAIGTSTSTRQSSLLNVQCPILFTNRRHRCKVRSAGIPKQEIWRKEADIERDRGITGRGKEIIFKIGAHCLVCGADYKY